MAKLKFYVVLKGLAVGIYREWFGPGGAEEQVKGVSGAHHKGFSTEDEARAYWRSGMGPVGGDWIEVYLDGQLASAFPMTKAIRSFLRHLGLIK